MYVIAILNLATIPQALGELREWPDWHQKKCEFFAFKELTIIAGTVILPSNMQTQL